MHLIVFMIEAGSILIVRVYPAEMEVAFQNREVLVAQPKDVLRLRLDPADE